MPTIGEKVDYVRRAKQTRDHVCHWPGCGTLVPPARWGCAKHWYALPKELRNKIWAAYRPGQEIDARPSEAYTLVAKQVRNWIVAYQGKAR